MWAASGGPKYYLLDVARVFPPVSQKHAPYPAMHVVTYVPLISPDVPVPPPPNTSPSTVLAPKRVATLF